MIRTYVCFALVYMYGYITIIVPIYFSVISTAWATIHSIVPVPMKQHEKYMLKNYIKPIWTEYNHSKTKHNNTV